MTPAFNFTIVKNSSEAKYIQLATALENWIISNNLPNETKMPSTRQLAKRLKLNVSTVDKALEELRKKTILQRRIGSGTYINSNRDNNRKLRIGLLSHETILPDFCYVSELLNSLNLFWEQQGYDLLPLKRNPEDYEKVFFEYSLSGMIIFNPQIEGLKKIIELNENHIPAVGIGQKVKEMPLLTFGTDYFKTSLFAVKHLADLGHRKIGIISIEGGDYAVTQREQGIIQGMYEANLPFNPKWLLRHVSRKSCNYEEELNDFLINEDRPTALILIAHGDIVPIYNILNKIGLSIPNDISLIGFDDPIFAAQMHPSLTVFAQAINKFTLQASNQLLNIIHGIPLVNPPSADPFFINRASCAPLTISKE